MKSITKAIIAFCIAFSVCAANAQAKDVVSVVTQAFTGKQWLLVPDSHEESSMEKINFAVELYNMPFVMRMLGLQTLEKGWRLPTPQELTDSDIPDSQGVFWASENNQQPFPHHICCGDGGPTKIWLIREIN